MPFVAALLPSAMPSFSTQLNLLAHPVQSTHQFILNNIRMTKTFANQVNATIYLSDSIIKQVEGFFFHFKQRFIINVYKIMTETYIKKYF